MVGGRRGAYRHAQASPSLSQPFLTIGADTNVCVMPVETPLCPATAPATAAPQPRLWLALGLVIAAAFLFAACDVAAKLMRETAPAPLVTWMRYVVFLAVALPYALARRGRAGLATRQPWLQIGRGVAAVMSTTTFIWSLAYLDVSSSTAIHFMSPIYITLLAVLVLRETVGVRQWLAAGIGFGGVLLIVRPGAVPLSAALLFPVASGLCWALGALFTRMMKAEPAETIFAWTGIVGTIGATLFVLPVWRLPVGAEWTYALIGSITFALAHLTTITAQRLAPLSLLAPITYAQLIFTGLMSVFIVGQTPDVWTLAGSVLIAAGGLEAARHGQARRGQAKAPSAGA